jgi:hypothetical protein
MSLLNLGPPPCMSEYNQTAQNTVTAQSLGVNEAIMARQNRSKRTKVRGNPPKAQFPAGLAEIISETVRLWRKHHLGYDQTKYVVEQARRRLKLQPMGTRRRTVSRLDKSEVERLIRNAYQSHSKYGLMIKPLCCVDESCTAYKGPIARVLRTLFLSGVRAHECSYQDRRPASRR